MYRIVLAMTLTLFLTVSAQADLLWDNYLSPDGYDHVSGKSSERNTFVTDSWTGDDVIPTADWIVQSIKWIGMVDPHPDAIYDAVDVIIYPANPDPQGYPIAPGAVPIAEFTDQPLSTTVIGDEFGLQVIEGTVDLPSDVFLDQGEHYYYAVRVVGNNRGRHYAATTGEGAFNGQTMGVFQSHFFHYTGEPNWVYVDQMGHPPLASDYAYQLHGIPEPASLVLLALGGLAFRRR